MSIEAMKRALEALENHAPIVAGREIKALRTAIQQAESAEAQTKTVDQVPTIDLDLCAWESIKESAAASPWIPHQYFQNDWVNDVCSFLRHPAPGEPDDVVRDADRLDWLARNPVDALDVFGKSRPDEARFIRATIDAAMLTAAQAQKGK